MRRTHSLIALLALAGSLTAMSPAGAAGEEHGDREEHCVIRVIGQKPSGEFVTTAPQCASTVEGAMKADARTAAILPGLFSLSGTYSLAWVVNLARHYDGANKTGSSITVVGSDCNGGYVNLTSSWDNRVSSTENLYCGTIYHYDFSDLIGGVEATYFNQPNLFGMNNRAESIQYL